MLMEYIVTYCINLNKRKGRTSLINPKYIFYFYNITGRIFLNLKPTKPII